MPIMEPMSSVSDPQEIILANKILKENGADAIALREEELHSILREEGVTLRGVIKKTKMIADYAENDGVSLAANKLFLEMYGVVGKKDKDHGQTINFIIAGQNPDVNINSILNPRR